MKRLLILPIISAAFMALPQSANAQWAATSGTTGPAFSLAASGGNIFAGTPGGGVFLTTNNGTNWSTVNTGLTNPNVYALAVSGGNLFAGTQGGGVFLSTNNGTNWTAVNTGLTNLGVNAFAVSGSNIFAGTGGGVFLSSNNGTNWTPVNTGLTSGSVLSLATSGGNLFAGTQGGGVCLTTNNGTNWAAVNTGLTNLTVLSLAAIGGGVFAGTNGGGVFVTTNNGTSWSAVNTGLTNFTVFSLAAIGGGVFAGTYGGGVCLTTNNGTNWTAVNTGLTNLYIHALMVSGSNIFAGVQASPGVWRRPLSDFGIPAVPVAPTLSSPANGAGMVILWPSFSWNAVTGATTYHIQLSPYSSFSPTIFYNDSSVTTTNWGLPGYDELGFSTTYYWRVRAKNSSGTSEWSAVWHFTTEPLPPAMPSLISPAPGATIAVPNVAFFHTAADTTAGYGLSVSTQSDFSTLAYPSGSTTLVASGRVYYNYNLCWVISGLSNNTTYFWRAVAINPGGSAYSPTWSFTMAFDTTPRCFAHWSFDSSSGNTYYDVTGNGYDATATGSVVGLASGVIGQALNCPDTGYDIAVANSPNNFNLSKFTIECWAYLNKNPSQYSVEAKLFEHQYLPPSGGMRNGYTLYIEPTGHAAFTLSSNNGGAWEQATSSRVIAEQTWYLLTATFDSSYLRLYVNGVLDASLSYQGTYLAPGANSRIGCQKRTNGIVSRFLDGMIDELKLYNYALPPDSVSAHYIPTAVKQSQKSPVLAEFLKVRVKNSLLTISLPSSMLGRAVDLAVYSASGRVVMQKRVARSSERFTLPTPNFATGAYVLSVKDGLQKKTVRFVVVR